MISSSRKKYYLVVLLLILSSLLIKLFTTYSFSLIVTRSPSIISNNNSQQETNSEKETVVVDDIQKPSYKTLKTVLSPSKLLYITPQLESHFDTSVLSFSPNSANGLYRVVQSNEVFDSDAQTTFPSEVISKEYSKYLDYLESDVKRKNGYNSVVAINHADNQIALILPHEIVIYTFTKSEETSRSNQSMKLPVIRITDSKRLKLDIVTNDYFYPQIFYSENDKYLYVANSGITSEVWGYRVNTSTFDYNPLEFNKTNFYPLSNSDGVVYWGMGEAQTSNNKYNTMDFITLDYITSKKTITVTDNHNNALIGSYDYDGYITVNPNHTKICAERGASGYWGYFVGEIEGDDLLTLDTGNQYSYCELWVDSTTILLHEKPYHNQFLERYYYYNTVTKVKDTIITVNQ